VRFVAVEISAFNDGRYRSFVLRQYIMDWETAK
jgi:hypothetical protein